jgi:hypothetical protein
MRRNVERLRINALREAIRFNWITFPSQVPVFSKHDRADLQRKIVQLYFLFGWSCSRIGGRYSLRRQRVQQIRNTWKRRAVRMGYLQSIPPALERFDRYGVFPDTAVVRKNFRRRFSF